MGRKTELRAQIERWAKEVGDAQGCVQVTRYQLDMESARYRHACAERDRLLKEWELLVESGN